jgi:hypothetical protein
MKNILLFLNTILFNPILKRLGFGVGLKVFQHTVWVEKKINHLLLPEKHYNFSIYPFWKKEKARSFVCNNDGIFLGQEAITILKNRNLVMFSGFKILSLGVVEKDDFSFQPIDNSKCAEGEISPEYFLFVKIKGKTNKKYFEDYDYGIYDPH